MYWRHYTNAESDAVEKVQIPRELDSLHFPETTSQSAVQSRGYFPRATHTPNMRNEHM
jgi:hypothetical protein